MSSEVDGSKELPDMCLAELSDCVNDLKAAVGVTLQGVLHHSRYFAQLVPAGEEKDRAGAVLSKLESELRTPTLPLLSAALQHFTSQQALLSPFHEDDRESFSESDIHEKKELADTKLVHYPRHQRLSSVPSVEFRLDKGMECVWNHFTLLMKALEMSPGIEAREMAMRSQYAEGLEKTLLRQEMLLLELKRLTVVLQERTPAVHSRLLSSLSSFFTGKRSEKCTRAYIEEKARKEKDLLQLLNRLKAGLEALIEQEMTAEGSTVAIASFADQLQVLVKKVQERIPQSAERTYIAPGSPVKFPLLQEVVTAETSAFSSRDVHSFAEYYLRLWLTDTQETVRRLSPSIDLSAEMPFRWIIENLESELISLCEEMEVEKLPSGL